MKKLDMILPKRDVDDLTRELLAAGAHGYSVMELTGSFGTRTGPLSQVNWSEGSNAYVFVLCEPDALDALVEAARPFVEKAGRMAFVSDVDALYM